MGPPCARCASPPAHQHAGKGAYAWRHLPPRSPSRRDDRLSRGGRGWTRRRCGRRRARWRRGIWRRRGDHRPAGPRCGGRRGRCLIRRHGRGGRCDRRWWLRCDGSARMLLRHGDADEDRGAAGNDDDGPREPLDATLRTRPGTGCVLAASALHGHWIVSSARAREPSIE